MCERTMERSPPRIAEQVHAISDWAIPDLRPDRDLLCRGSSLQIRHCRWFPAAASDMVKHFGSTLWLDI
jgi:hypothetical protein